MNPIIVRRETTETAAGASAEDVEFQALPELIRHIYRSRGVTTSRDCSYSLDALLPPSQLKGIDAATRVLFEAIQLQRRILIVGDFDADGATSCALAVKALEAFGHRDVRFMVPNRFEFGYGLTPEIVHQAQQQQPELIITVDNGISSVEGVALAKSQGIKVLVTDHHLPGSSLPDADVIVNPNQADCDFASKALAGVGVIFYVMCALRSHLREQNWFSTQGIEEPRMAEFLDLVALGTVADVVPLDRNNRILVEQGLRRIRSGSASAGVRALIEVSGKSASHLTASDLGFALGPRLNAAGRLDDISIGIAALMSNDLSLARDIAHELDAMNQDRRQIESSMHEQAKACLDELAFDSQTMPRALSLYNEDWHQGVVGIVASRVKEKHHRPVVCFARAEDGSDLLKGSARSISGFHIKDALELVASRNPGLIDKFGGHAMAAGLSLRESALADFEREFSRVAGEWLREEDMQSAILSDGELGAGQTTIDNAMLIERAGPWGQQFPEPVFDGEFEVINQKLLAGRHLKLVLRANATSDVIDAIAFNIDPSEWPAEQVGRVRIAYKLSVNRFRGRESAQLMIECIEKLA